MPATGLWLAHHIHAPAPECPRAPCPHGSGGWPEPEAPGDDRERWQELVRTMLPAPVSVHRGDWMVVSAHAIHWDSHRPVMAPVGVASFRLDEARPARVAGAIAEARAERVRAYGWCPMCREVRPPEWMAS